MTRNPGIVPHTIGAIADITGTIMDITGTVSEITGTVPDIVFFENLMSEMRQLTL